MSGLSETLRAAFSRHPYLLISLFALHLGTGVLGLWPDYTPQGTTLLWLPSGVGLGTLLVFGYALWPVVFASSVVICLVSLGAVPAVPLLAAGHTSEVLLAAYLVNRYANGRHALRNPQNCFRFAAVTVLAATASGATFNGLSLVLTGVIGGGEYGAAWMAHSVGSLVGMLLAAPPIVLWSQGAVAWRLRPAIETLAMLFVAVLSGLQAFFGFPLSLPEYPMQLLCLPVLLWAAFRLGQRASAVALLIVAGLAVAGTLNAMGPFVRSTPFTSLMIVQLFVAELAVMTTALAALSADYEEAEAQLLELAVTDPLTGLANYRRLLEVIAIEIGRAERHGRRFAIVFFDMDGLKRINDELGHVAGSRAVCRFAETFSAELRGTDTAARYGGDEFVAVLSDTDRDGAELVLERTNRRLAEDPNVPAISVSAGVATYPHDGRTPTTLLSAADRALYARKAAKGTAIRAAVIDRRERAESAESHGAG